jgi:hypothetical protein
MFNAPAQGEWDLPQTRLAIVIDSSGTQLYDIIAAELQPP